MRKLTDCPCSSYFNRGLDDVELRRIRAEYELRELLAWKVHLGQHGVATVGARARGVSSGACASLDREGIEYDRVWPLATRYGRSDRNVPELEVASFDGRVRRG